MSRERIKKIAAAIKKIEMAMEPKKGLSEYQFCWRDGVIFGSKEDKDKGPSEPVRRIDSSQRLRELEKEISDAVEDLRNSGFSEDQIQVLLKEPIRGPRFVYKEKGEVKSQEASSQKITPPSLPASTTKEESNHVKTEDPEESSDLVRLMAGRKPSKKFSIDEG